MRVIRTLSCKPQLDAPDGASDRVAAEEQTTPQRDRAAGAPLGMRPRSGMRAPRRGRWRPCKEARERSRCRASGFTNPACPLRVQRQVREQTCQRVRSGLTQQVTASEVKKFSVHAMSARETLINSTSSFRRTPEPSQIKHLDPGVRRGDELFSASQGNGAVNCGFSVKLAQRDFVPLSRLRGEGNVQGGSSFHVPGW